MKGAMKGGLSGDGCWTRFDLSVRGRDLEWEGREGLGELRDR